MDVNYNDLKRRRVYKREMVQTVLNNKKRQQFHPLTIYQTSLTNFAPPPFNEENKPPREFTKSNDSLIDEFFEFVAITGKPLISWEILKSAFIWKLQTVMDDMHINEAEEQADDILKENLIKNESISQTKKFILEKAKTFEGIPFTIQRLCELINTPNRHYRTTEKYLRALEKNINIVMTITETGERSTGIEHFVNEEDNLPLQVERNFIVSVDELDVPLPTLMVNGETNGYKTLSNNEAEAKNSEYQSDDKKETKDIPIFTSECEKESENELKEPAYKVKAGNSKNENKLFDYETQTDLTSKTHSGIEIEFPDSQTKNEPENQEKTFELKPRTISEDLQMETD